MIKRFHYFKPDSSNTECNGISTLDISEKVEADFEDFEFYQIQYKTSVSQPPIKIQVPNNFTVFQDQQKPPFQNLEELEKGNKIRVFLIGNEHCPDLSFLQSPILVDRIEFNGNIRYEKPIFEMIRQLRQVKKVKFFLGSKQSLEYFEWALLDEMDQREKQIFTNPSVTSLAVIVSKKFTRQIDAAESPIFGFEEGKIKPENVVERMVVRILKQSATYFPHLRKLTVEAPNSPQIHDAICTAIESLKYLKNTMFRESYDGKQLIVMKAEESTFAQTMFPNTFSSSDNLEEKISTNHEDESKETCVGVKLDDPISTSPVNKDEDYKLQNSEEEKSDPPVVPPPENNLTGLGKMLESMLGIGMGGVRVGGPNETKNPTISNIFSKITTPCN